MTRRLLGPFNRVEGDLEVNVEISDGFVRDARVSSPLYRGFEHMLRGKDPLDALVFVPRICGICSVSQSVAAAKAIAMAQGVVPVPNGRLAMDITHAIENISDHLTHFHMFFMPDFCREVYAGESWHADVRRDFEALKGDAIAPFLAARAAYMNALGILAGKWPHTLSVQPGGSTRAIEGQEQQRLLLMVIAFRRYLERHVYGGSLEEFAGLADEHALDAWVDAAKEGYLRVFLRIARSLALAKLGRAEDRFMSYGSFGNDDDKLFKGGIFAEGELKPLKQESITEDISHSWMQQSDGERHPFDGVTHPDADAKGGYTWCKAPRLSGRTMEVGAFARQVVNGQALARALVGRDGGNVRNRIIGRFIEVAILMPAVEQWIRALRPRDPFCVTVGMPDISEGFGLTEAARGSLGHWLKVRAGRIANYQIIAPTTWNFSPRDAVGQAGPLEKALEGAPVRVGETDPVSVQHIVRSFDPCMVCTVH